MCFNLHLDRLPCPACLEVCVCVCVEES